MDKYAITKTAIDDLLARRWSGRAYDPDRPLSAKQILSLLEAGHWSPSCFGESPWRYIVCNKSTHQTAWNKVLESLAEGNKAWAKQAVLLLVAIAANTFFHNQKPNRWAQYDLGAASENICLQAISMDLVIHQMGGFDAEKIGIDFNIPSGHTTMSVLAIGHRLPLEKLSAQEKERECGARSRPPMENSFFVGKWGVGVDSEQIFL